MLKRDKALLSLVAVQVIAAGFYLTLRGGASIPPAKLLSVLPDRAIGSKGDLRGDTNAPYTLVEFGDYQCPPCARAHPYVVALLARHPQQIRFQFRHLPLRIHFYAPQAAFYAELSRDGGNFWKTHDSLYELNAKVDNAALLTFAPSNKPSESSIAAAKARLRSDALAAEKIKITSTPSFILCCPDGKVLKLSSLAQAEDYLQ